jgi:hypothetical protein
MNDILTDKWHSLTIRYVVSLLFMSSTGPPYTEKNPTTYEESCLGKRCQLAHSNEEWLKGK